MMYIHFFMIIYLIFILKLGLMQGYIFWITSKFQVLEDLKAT